MEDSVIRKIALKNAVLHKGKTSVGFVIPKLLAIDSSLKSRIDSIVPKVKKIVDEVNSMAFEEQKKELLSIDPKALEKEKKEEVKELPEIEGIKVGKCSFRLPPAPEKELHIGHALSYTLNYYYAKKYKGKLILRIEDTNPEKCSMDYVIGNKNDIKAIGIKWDEEYFLSDNMDKYYKLCTKLIKEEKAYACTCSPETIRENRNKHIRCKCAEHTVNENLRHWNKMRYGVYKEGKCVIRFKGDMNSKNSTMWDPIIFRVVNKKHYRQGSRYHAWPMYDFTAAIEDSKITHVLRDANWTQRIELQDAIREALGIKKHPTNILYSRYEVKGGVTKGRVIRELVEKGVVTGYDDIRLTTIKGLLRRGIQPQVFLELLKDVGITKSKTTITMEKIYSINRRIIEPIAKHFFFVEDPVEYDIDGKTIVIQKSDLTQGVIRLKDGFNIEIRGEKAVKKGEELIKGVPIVQWLYKEDGIETEVIEGKPLFDDKGNLNENSLVIHKGLVDKRAMELEDGSIVQFERFGYCKKEGDHWIYIHK